MVCYCDLLVIQVERDGEKPDHHPDCDGDSNRYAVVALLLGQWVDHRPVTLDTYAGDKGDGAVHVAVEKCHQHFAKSFSIDPVVPIEVVCYLQGDPDDKEQVSQSQVCRWTTGTFSWS